MELTTLDQPAEGIVCLSLSGRFDAHEAEGFRHVVDDVLSRGTNRLAITLTEVVFVDSAALAELVRGMKRCRERGGDLTLVAPSDPVRVILELTKLDAAFSIS